MRWLSNMTTQSRISLVVGALALVAAVSAILGINAAAAQQQNLVDLKESVTSLAGQSSARADLIKQEVALNHTLLYNDERQQALGELYRYNGDFTEYLYQQMLNADPEQQKGLEALLAASDALDTQLSAIFDQLGAENLDEAVRLNQENFHPAVTALDAQVNDLAATQLQDINAQVDAVESRIRTNIQAGQIVLIVLVLLVIWGIYTAINISGPLASLTSAIVAFENKIFKPEMLARYANRRDELGQLAQAVSRMAESITASNLLKDRFLQAASRFIPTQYLDFLEKDDITKVSLGDNIAAEMAVMFSDIRGFTTMSEKMSAQENFDFVNEYLNLVSPIIQKHEGFIVKFLGDGMMAIFPYGVQDAVQAGIEKQEAVKAFNEVLAKRGFPPITVGIGIHTGAMMVGMIGEEARLQGDAFSDNVNLTSRLEGLNKFYGTSLIISEDTLRQIQQPVPFHMRYLGKAVVKGRIAPLGLYEIYEGLPEDVMAIKDATKADFEGGIAAYTSARFADAGAAFSRVLKTDPNDKTARYYLERCAEWVQRQAPSDWNGAIVMDAK